MASCNALFIKQTRDSILPSLVYHEKRKKETKKGQSDRLLHIEIILDKAFQVWYLVQNLPTQVFYANQNEKLNHHRGSESF